MPSSAAHKRAAAKYRKKNMEYLSKNNFTINLIFLMRQTLSGEVLKYASKNILSHHNGYES